MTGAPDFTADLVPEPASVTPGRGTADLVPEPASVTPGRGTADLVPEPASVTPGRGTVALVPEPASVTLVAGTATLGDGLVIEAPAELAGVARWFRQLLESANGWLIDLVPPAGGATPPAGGGRIRLGIGLVPGPPGTGPPGEETPNGAAADRSGTDTPTGAAADRSGTDTPTGAAADRSGTDTPTGAAADRSGADTPTGAAADRSGADPGARDAAGGPGPARARMPGEAYRLRVASDGVDITGAAAAGVFYGLQTLRQLLPDSCWRAAPAHAAPVPPVQLAGIEILDAPAFAWRGVHLDVSRHFLPKAFLLKLVDLIALHKCNVLHLHLTDDQGWRMPIEAYPRLVEVGAWRRESPVGHYRDRVSDGRPHGGFYSTDDLREIVAYAAERFVEVLPEIDMPGHMVAAIAAYPELGNTLEPREVLTRWGISKHVLNLEPATLEFCRSVLDEVAGVFPWGYLHVGGDECPTKEWEASESAQALMREEGFGSERELQGWFTGRMAEHLAERDRVLVGWDEILEGGAPAGSVVMSWRGEEGGIEAASAGHDVIMAPQQWLYFDWSYADDPREPLAICPATSVERVWSYDPVPDSIPPDRRHHVLGAQCQLWTEYVPSPEHAEYLYFPRVSAFAEVVWRGPASRRSGAAFGEFEERLGRHLGRLDALGVNYRPLAGPTRGQSRIWSEE